MATAARTPTDRLAPPPRPRAQLKSKQTPLKKRSGMSPGVNIAPGSEDDGWCVPPRVELADGTSVQLYKDGEALRAAFEAIKAATKRICLEVYIFADDSTGHAFADLLCEKAKAGVAVYLIFDSFGSFGGGHLWRKSPAMFEQMRRAGIRMQEFSPMRPWEVKYSWRPVNRDHRKLLIVDDVAGGLGGLNIGREYAGSWVVASEASKKEEDTPWRDNAIGVTGPGARHLLRAFGATWRYNERGGRVARAEYQYGIHDQPFGLLASAPTMASPLRPLLCELLGGARSSIEMTMAYFAPDDDLVSELLKACKRGVRVRLMLPGRSDVKILITAAQSFYECLMDEGAEIYERQSAILHAKTMCIDKKISIIGSANLDIRSIEYNCELSAIIRNETFGKQMHELFENDVCFAKRIDPVLWRTRDWRDRMGQWCVSRARYLL